MYRYGLCAHLSHKTIFFCRAYETPWCLRGSLQGLLSEHKFSFLSFLLIYLFILELNLSLPQILSTIESWYNQLLSVTSLLLSHARFIVVGRLSFYRDSSSIFFRQLPLEHIEWNSTKTGHMFESECDLKTHVQNLGYIPSP